MGCKAKEQAKAEADTIAQAKSDTLSSTNEELSLTNQYISDLHKGCDFLMENYDFRKTARSQETEALAKAKATLRVNTNSTRMLRRSLISSNAARVKFENL